MKVGYVVATSADSIWLRFHISLGSNHSVRYKYIAVVHKSYQGEPFWETMHKGGDVDRRLNRSDFKDGSSKIKYDGHVEFGGLKESKKGWLDKRFEKSKAELKHYQMQNMLGFAFYARKLIEIFTEHLDVESFVNEWHILMKTLSFVRWSETVSNFHENLDYKLLIEHALRCFDDMSEEMEPPVGENESFEVILLKLSVLLFISSDQHLIEQLDLKQWEKLQQWFMFKNEDSKSTFVEFVSSKMTETTLFFDAIRDQCQLILKTGSQNKMKSSSFFYVFFEWAFLDNSHLFLKIPSDLRLSKTSYEALKVSYTSPATNRHLLILAALKESPDKRLNLGKNWLTSDILSCLLEVWKSRCELPETFLSLLHNFMLSLDSSVHETQLSFKLTYLFIKSVVERESYLHPGTSRHFLNVFMHRSLDILAIVDVKTDGDMLKLKSNFYDVVDQLTTQINCRDLDRFVDNDIFYWANLLKYRPGYCSQSVEFIDNRIRKHLLKFLSENNTARDSIPKFCVELPQIVESLNQKGLAIDCCENLNSALEESFIDSIFSSVKSSVFDVNLILHDNRPRVAEAFCRVVEKFPKVSKRMSAISIIEKVLDYQPIAMISDQLEKRNPTVDYYFGDQVKLMREAFAEVVCLIQRGEINAKEFQIFSNKRKKVADLCQKLRVFDQNSVIAAFTRIDAVYTTLLTEIRRLSKLLELTNKFKSRGIKIDTSDFEVLHKEWESYQFNKLVDLKPQSLEFSIVPELPTFDDIRAVELYAELMTSVIFTNYATEMIKSSFEKSQEPVFTYRHFLTVEMRRVHRYYLQLADTLAKGHLTLSETKTIFKPCTNNSIKSKEMDFFFKFLKRENPLPDVVAELDRKLETRKKLLKEIDSLGKSVVFMRALRKLVDLLGVTNLYNNFNHLKSLVSSYFVKNFIKNC